MRALALEQVELVGQALRRRRGAQLRPRRRRAGRARRDSAPCVKSRSASACSRHDAVVLRAFDRARRRRAGTARSACRARAARNAGPRRRAVRARMADAPSAMQLLFPESPAPSRGQRRDASRSPQPGTAACKLAQRRLVAGDRRCCTRSPAMERAPAARATHQPASRRHGVRHRRQHPAAAAHAPTACDRRAATPTSPRVRPSPRWRMQHALRRRCNRGTGRLPPASPFARRSAATSPSGSRVTLASGAGHAPHAELRRMRREIMRRRPARRDESRR